MRLNEWQFHHPTDDGDTSFLFNLGDAKRLEFEARSSHLLVLNAVSPDGETVFLSRGNVVHHEGRLDGFQALEIVTPGSFATRSSFKRASWLEKNDPEPITVIIEQPADPVKAEIRRQVAAQMRRHYTLRGGTVDELIDDVENGDLEFEDEQLEMFTDYEEMDEFDDDPPASPPPPSSPSKEGPTESAVSATVGGETDEPA